MEFLAHTFLHTMEHALEHSLPMLPFLFVAFLLLEALEHYSSTWVSVFLYNGDRSSSLYKTGPLLGALLGCVPQCGFSVMAANLYAGGVISPGTLISVFLSTSDEAILILLGHPGADSAVLKLLCAKIVVSVITGYAVDLFVTSKIVSKKQTGNLCPHCGCHAHHGIIRPAMNHTLRLFAYIFLVSALLDLLLETLGFDALSGLLLKDSIFQPFLAALIGFIPNCAASVLLTELYLGGGLSFAAVLSGLCTNAGVGLAILLRVNGNKAETLKIAGVLYASAVIAGLVSTLFDGIFI